MSIFALIGSSKKNFKNIFPTYCYVKIPLCDPFLSRSQFFKYKIFTKLPCVNIVSREVFFKHFSYVFLCKTLNPAWGLGSWSERHDFERQCDKQWTKTLQMIRWKIYQLFHLLQSWHYLPLDLNEYSLQPFLQDNSSTIAKLQRIIVCDMFSVFESQITVAAASVQARKKSFSFSWMHHCYHKHQYNFDKLLE